MAARWVWSCSVGLLEDVCSLSRGVEPRFDPVALLATLELWLGRAGSAGVTARLTAVSGGWRSLLALTGAGLEEPDMMRYGRFFPYAPVTASMGEHERVFVCVWQVLRLFWAMTAMTQYRFL